MPTSPASAARSAASPSAAAKPQRNGPTATWTWPARISLLAVPLLAVALSGRLRAGPRVFTKAELAQYVDTVPLLAMLASALRRETGPRVFTKAELAKYVDTRRGLKVAICGQVFDVSKGADFYAKGAGYGFFAGKDASLAFATGNFKTNLTDNVSSLADAQLLELQNWVNETYHKKYVYEGVAVGADHPSAFSERRVDGVPWRAIVRESIAATAWR